ncbi:hypothetical protein COOONC_02438 [Cooperia oncophora]
MAGSYLAKNTNWTRNFLRESVQDFAGFANYEFRLPNSHHGTDNGAIHAYLAEVILPNTGVDFMICLEIYKNSKGFQDLFLYEACMRDLLERAISFDRIKIPAQVEYKEKDTEALSLVG